MIEVKEISLDDRRGKKKFFRFIIDLMNLPSSTLR